VFLKEEALEFLILLYFRPLRRLPSGHLIRPSKRNQSDPFDDCLDSSSEDEFVIGDEEITIVNELKNFKEIK